MGPAGEIAGSMAVCISAGGATVRKDESRRRCQTLALCGLVVLEKDSSLKRKGPGSARRNDQNGHFAAGFWDDSRRDHPPVLPFERRILARGHQLDLPHV